MNNAQRTPLRLSPIALALLTFGVNAAAQTSPAASEATLPGVTVRSKYEREDLPRRAPGNKTASGARLGILGATAIIEAPVHVNAYTRELAEDWSALTLQDVLENDPAVVFTTNKGHLLQNFNLRGLDMGAMDIATNGLYGIAPANQVPTFGDGFVMAGAPRTYKISATVSF